ncbi:diaminopimelate epimerase [Catalinimonas alkaloidigena]|uniref:diaminopimelate epimerase n=1 Tax=Catalinimonas alkaloidigena TaxID=1075417 RepID=UPI0030B8B632|nr:diaminopimelate epimerase [Catalinimonas alkaloidigena]
MNTMHFYKYQGTGNDFVMIDNREGKFPQHDEKLIQRLCHRKFGIGADGLILLQDHDEYDFEMIYYNADATTSMCGNGSRCAVHLAHHLGMIGKHSQFYAEDGFHEARIEGEQIHIRMVDVVGIEEVESGYFMNTGTRHYVRFVEDLTDYDVMGVGKKIRYHEAFVPQGTNASFVEMKGDEVHMRIYEKGVENETLSSGTGVTAVALTVAKVKGLASPITINTQGGILQVSFRQLKDNFYTDIYMIGPAVMVFEGTVFV